MYILHIFYRIPFSVTMGVHTTSIVDGNVDGDDNTSGSMIMRGECACIVNVMGLLTPVFYSGFAPG